MKALRRQNHLSTKKMIEDGLNAFNTFKERKASCHIRLQAL